MIKDHVKNIALSQLEGLELVWQRVHRLDQARDGAQADEELDTLREEGHHGYWRHEDGRVFMDWALAGPGVGFSWVRVRAELEPGLEEIRSVALQYKEVDTYEWADLELTEKQRGTVHASASYVLIPPDTLEDELEEQEDDEW